MGNPQLRLIVYRETSGRPRMRWPILIDPNSQVVPEPATPGEWHEEIYSWSTGSDEQVAPLLSSTLAQEFGEGLPAGQRTPRKLLEVALKLREKVAGEWSISQEVIGAEDESAPAMVNPSAALVEHVRWIADTFANLPQVHIVIR